MSSNRERKEAEWASAVDTVFYELQTYPGGLSADECDPDDAALNKDHPLFIAVEAMRKIRPLDGQGRALWVKCKILSRRVPIDSAEVCEALAAFDAWLTKLCPDIADASEWCGQCRDKPPEHEKPKGMAGLTEAVRKAYLGFAAAEEHTERRLTDREAYDWLEAEGPAELGDLPTFTTWSRQLREARRMLDEQKHSPRAGRTGRSVVRLDELDEI